MPRWLGIDHGHKRIGVAVGSTEDALASPVEVLDAAPLPAAMDRIERLADEYGACGIVVGWPVNMDDTEGPQAREARAMAARLAEAVDLDVRLWDERLSSFAADEVLAGHLTRAKRRARQDAIAAAEILREFFRGKGPEAALRPDQVEG